MRLPFFNYTVKKFFISLSTYIVLSISAFVPWILAFIFNKSLYVSISVFFTFPIFMIFISYKIAQIFRDEIENNTILTIQSKPISRKQIILQGYFALTIIVIFGIFINTFLPMFFAVIFEGSYHFEKPFLISMGMFILSSIIMFIGILLSLVAKGKVFIGIMIGGFGIGFYVLYFVSMICQSVFSTTAKLNNFDKKLGFLSLDEDSDNILKISVNTGSSTEDIKNMYEYLEDQKFAPYDVIKWFDPYLHFANMFSGNWTFDNDIDKNSTLLFYNFASTQVRIKDLNWEIQDQSFTFSFENKRIIPVWYPYFIWMAFSGVVIALSFKKIQKMNFA